MQSNKQLYELIIADDFSDDGTDAVCAKLQTAYPLRLLSRKEDRGLSQAVLAAIAIADGDIIVVMDADLSHHRYSEPTAKSASKIAERFALLLINNMAADADSCSALMRAIASAYQIHALRIRRIVSISVLTITPLSVINISSSPLSATTAPTTLPFLSLTLSAKTP